MTGTSPSAGAPLVVHVIPTAVGRGAQREARAIADGLGRAGIRRHIVLSLFDGPHEVRVDEALDHPGGDRPAQGVDPRLIVRLALCLRRLRPAVVVAHGGDALKYLVPATALRHRPIVYYATGTFSGGSGTTTHRLWKLLMRRAAVVAAEGDEVLEECTLLLGVPRQRLVLVPNGRDPNEFHPVTRTEATPPVVGFVGALTAGKRPDVFIEIVRMLRTRGASFQAVLCGEGPLAGELEASAKVADVKLLGYRDDVAAVLQGIDVMVFPSLPTGEGMPGVLIEAGLTGVPVVATDVPGVRAIVSNEETGIVVSTDDLDAMVDATAHLIDDPGLRVVMGAAARACCEAHFSTDNVTACWESIVAPLVNRPPTRSGG